MRISDWSSDVCSSDLVSQGGYVHLILSANISGSPGTLLGGVSKMHCWLQRKPSSGSTWHDIHNWLMYSNGTIQYDDDGVLESTGNNIAVSATTQSTDKTGSEDTYAYRWLTEIGRE